MCVLHKILKLGRRLWAHGFHNSLEHLLFFHRAIAASAPIFQFTGLTPCEIFNRIVTSAYSSAASECAASIRKSWAEINELTSSGNACTYFFCHKLYSYYGLFCDTQSDLMKEAVSAFEMSAAVVTAKLWMCSTFLLASKVAYSLSIMGDFKLISMLCFFDKLTLWLWKWTFK